MEAHFTQFKVFEKITIIQAFLNGKNIKNNIREPISLLYWDIYRAGAFFKLVKAILRPGALNMWITYRI